jgi:cell division septum initiation protein DivIVA
MKFDGGKVMSEAPANDGKLAMLAAAGANLDALVEKTEKECQAMLVTARAEAGRIIADAQLLSDRVKAKCDGFFDAMAKSKKELGFLD